MPMSGGRGNEGGKRSEYIAGKAMAPAINSRDPEAWEGGKGCVRVVRRERRYFL